jgi:hypothetical protein
MISRASLLDNGFPKLLRDSHIEFLKNLCADTTGLVFPQSPDLRSGDFLLGSGIRIVGIN